MPREKLPPHLKSKHKYRPHYNMGPVFHPEQCHRDLVHELSGLITQPEIATILKITVPTLVRHFREELDLGAAQKNAIVGKLAFTKIVKEGNLDMMKFWLARKMRWLEKDVVDADPTEALAAKSMDDLSRELAELQQRRQIAMQELEPEPSTETEQAYDQAA